MASEYTVGKKNKVRQLRENAVYDTETVHAILNSALIASVGFVQDGEPVVVPMLFGRERETIFLHGARKARIIRLLKDTGTACLNVTHVDGLVYARSAFNSSMNYRSVTVFGSVRLIEDPDEKLHALRVISDCTMPGRWDELRAPQEKELKMTGVIALSIESTSAKIGSRGCLWDVEAGVLPLQSAFATVQTDDRVIAGVEPSGVIKTMEGKVL